ncbi:MAG: DUF4340 domain-containing protein [Hyphomicrobiaceae bacterium]
MIKPHHFITLAAAALVSVLLALFVYASANRWSEGHIEGEALLPGLADHVRDVKAIEITQTGKKLTIERGDSTWKLKEKGGFPVKPEAVRTLVVALTEAQLIEPKTAIKSKLDLLELEDPSGKDAKSRGVRLLDASGKAIADVVFGKTRWDAFGSGRGGIYARRASQTQSWLATGDPKITSDVTDWVDTKVFAADKGKVARLTVEHAGEAPLVIEKGPAPKPAAPTAEASKEAKPAPAKAPAPADDAKYHLTGIPEGKKLKKDVKIDDMVEAFNTLELEDVRKLDAPPAGTDVTVLRLEQTGGATVVFRLRKDGDARWISLEATGTDAAAKKAADALNAKAKGWEFKIPTWRGDQMSKRRADLFETS